MLCRSKLAQNTVLHNFLELKRHMYMSKPLRGPDTRTLRLQGERKKHETLARPYGSHLKIYLSLAIENVGFISENSLIGALNVKHGDVSRVSRSTKAGFDIRDGPRVSDQIFVDGFPRMNSKARCYIFFHDDGNRATPRASSFFTRPSDSSCSTYLSNFS